MMLAGCLKEILTSYENEKSKRFTDNPLVFKIRNDLPKEFSNLINNDEYTVKAACGVSSWPEAPWVSIISNTFDSSQEALIIQYNFDIEKSLITLSVISRLKDTSLKKSLLNCLKAVNLNDFRINNDVESSEIIVKYYSYDQLNNTTLKSDLDFIIPIYEELSDIYKKFVCNDQSENLMSENFSGEIKVKDIKVRYNRNDSYLNSINNPKELLSDENIEKIIRCNIKISDYHEILADIKQSAQSAFKNTVDEYNLDLSSLKIRDKILLIAKSFTDVEYKSVGRLLGSYSFNTIRIDDRLSNALIITSIIHELTHFIVEKILKEILMKVLNTTDTPLISGFVKILLEDDLNYLLDEYCAHSVEGRFTLYGYQDYSSFNYKLNEISQLFSKDDIQYSLIIANTLAYDIKDILEDFIDEDLREDIKDEFFKLNDRPDYEALEMEIDSRLEDDYLVEAFAIVLTSGIGEAVNNPQKLERYMAKFSKVMINF